MFLGYITARQGGVGQTLSVLSAGGRVDGGHLQLGLPWLFWDG